MLNGRATARPFRNSVKGINRKRDCKSCKVTGNNNQLRKKMEAWRRKITISRFTSDWTDNKNVTNLQKRVTDLLDVGIIVC